MLKILFGQYPWKCISEVEIFEEPRSEKCSYGGYLQPKAVELQILLRLTYADYLGKSFHRCKYWRDEKPQDPQNCVAIATTIGWRCNEDLYIRTLHAKLERNRKSSFWEKTKLKKYLITHYDADESTTIPWQWLLLAYRPR